MFHFTQGYICHHLKYWDLRARYFNLQWFHQQFEFQCNIKSLFHGLAFIMMLINTQERWSNAIASKTVQSQLTFEPQGHPSASSAKIIQTQTFSQLYLQEIQNVYAQNIKFLWIHFLVDEERYFSYLICIRCAHLAQMHQCIFTLDRSPTFKENLS